ncbi:hypothetical protein N7461_008410 [Penicillium sp. DV-2018c]|nr:hypothetical protein N7461_008410 [Penicillium sp. DV-2018c]
MNDGAYGDCFLSVHLLPEPDEGGNYTWPTCEIGYNVPIPGIQLIPDPPVLPPTRIRPDHPMTFWCSAAQRTASSTHFAIGTSEGLHTLEAANDTWVLSKKPFNGQTVQINNRAVSERRRYQNTVHAVEWLSPTVIAAGQKSSRIFLHDLRSAASATRLRHNDAVMDMKSMDEYRLVAAGPTSLRMYDLRFAPTASNRSFTTPYLTFPDYGLSALPNFDLNAELGLLAHPSHDCRVQIFSLQTGRQVLSPLMGHRYASPPTCVRFEYGNDAPEWRGPHAPSLLVGAEDIVEQWTW